MMSCHGANPIFFDKKNEERLYVQNTRYPHPLLFYAGAVVVTNRLGAKIDKVAWRKAPMWKRRLQNKIKELRKDLSQLEASKDKAISNYRHWERLERKYSIRVKRLNVVIEELKQRITAIAANVRGIKDG